MCFFSVQQKKNSEWPKLQSSEEWSVDLREEIVLALSVKSVRQKLGLKMLRVDRTDGVCLQVTGKYQERGEAYAEMGEFGSVPS